MRQDVVRALVALGSGGGWWGLSVAIGPSDLTLALGLLVALLGLGGALCELRAELARWRLPPG